MSETSEAEKRRILRERRQQKFGNGGGSSRLAKITGQTDNSFLSTDSPLDSNSSSPGPVAQKDNQESTKEMDELLARLAQNESKHVKDVGPKSSAKSPELDLFAQLVKMQGGDASTQGATPETPDLFAELMKSMQADSQQGAQPDFPFGTCQPPIDAAVLAAHNASVNKLKAYTIIVKWVFFILPYIYYTTHAARKTFESSDMEAVTSKFSFFTIFTTFEIVTLSVYYQLLLSAEKSHHINTLNSNSKILSLVSMIPPGLVPIKNLPGKTSQALQYWDVLSMYLTDLAFTILLIGLFQYYWST
ncbi:LAME_0F14906g1_1 [Lachancea meyersii CBS 8951]|uniref:Golgi to ER traffic protein 2 n=1 Tax=Lachancea meyersii CBS 8951 TaxID=1266667 RepID=A0A1G4JY61_9SACH|nr:LAME_0F14906g1_1 [Lachancea meyersii CBS 8951]